LLVAIINGIVVTQSQFPLKVGENDGSSCDTMGSTFDIDEPGGSLDQYILIGGKTKSKAFLQSQTGCYTEFVPFIQIYKAGSSGIAQY
jgi:hypothetical protein